METTHELLNVNAELLAKGRNVLRAINHPLRQSMLKLIHSQGRIAVTDIYVKLRLEQSVASQHLAILRESGFVITERDGKRIFYSVNYQRLKQVGDLCLSMLAG